MKNNSPMSTMKELLRTMPQTGIIEWIIVRPERKEAPIFLEEVEVTVEDGLEGDHYNGRSQKRQVTLIQKEHLDTVASILKKEIDVRATRRNLVVSGINLLALKGQQFQIGEDVVLEMTGLCHPCSKMETNLGLGGYNAMRGHGGITAKVIHGGTIKKENAVKLL